MTTSKRVFQYLVTALAALPLVIILNALMIKFYSMHFRTVGMAVENHVPSLFFTMLDFIQAVGAYPFGCIALAIILGVTHGPKGHRDVLHPGLSGIAALVAMAPFAAHFSDLHMVYKDGGSFFDGLAVGDGSQHTVLTFLVFSANCCVGLVLRRAYLAG